MADYFTLYCEKLYIKTPEEYEWLKKVYALTPNKDFEEDEDLDIDAEIDRIKEELGLELHSGDFEDPYNYPYPQHQYDYDEFYYEIIYEWLNTLVDSGELGYDDEMGDMGEFYLRDKSLKISSDFLSKFKCYFHWNVLNKKYQMGTCNNPSNRLEIMKQLERNVNVTDSNDMDYVLTEFFIKLPEVVKNLSEEKNISIMNEIYTYF